MSRNLKHYFVSLSKPKDDASLKENEILNNDPPLDAKLGLNTVLTAAETEEPSLWGKNNEVLDKNPIRGLMQTVPNITSTPGVCRSESNEESSKPASNPLLRFLVRGQNAAELNKQSLQRVKLTVQAMVHSPLHHDCHNKTDVKPEVSRARRRPLCSITNPQADSIELVSSELVTNFPLVNDESVYSSKIVIPSDDAQDTSRWKKLHKRNIDENTPEARTAVKRKRQ